MAIHLRNPETEALARKLAARLKTSLTEVGHIALVHELERLEARVSLVDRTREYARALRTSGDPSRGLPADKDFIDSLYED
ncbi:MAG TPA: type II toxin-antitoxin system VapB family antitoxin [Rhizobiales bacterium]|nr:type II toxin-antitoxin system VapB family antitoxin [Hyphomicrobiales bacterium]